MAPENIEVLAINAGSPTPLQVIRCLHQEGVTAAAADERPPERLFAARSRFCRGYYRHEGYSKLAEIGEKLGNPVLLCCDDRSENAITRRLEELSEHFTIPYPEYDVLIRGQDKGEAWQTCIEAGIPTPRTYLPGRDGIERLADEVEYPVLVKSRVTLGFIPLHRRKLYICRDREELISSYSKVDGTHPDPLVQELVPGGDDSVYEIMVMVDRNQELVGSFCIRKLAQWPIGFGVGCLCRSVHNEVVLEQSLRFLKEMGWFGLACIEFKHDERDSSYKLIDANMRFCGETSMAMAAGINLPHALYQLALGETPHIGDYPDGLIWTDTFKAMRNIRARFRDGGGVMSILATSFRVVNPRTARAVLSISDPGPTSMIAERFLDYLTKPF